MVKNFKFSIVSNIIAALSKFLILFLIIRIGTPVEVGIYNYALVLSAPIFLLVSLKIRSIIVTNRLYELNDYYTAIFLLNFITLLIISIISLIFFETIIAISLIIVSTIKFIENIKEVIYGLYQKDENLKLIGYSIVITNILNLFVFSLNYYISKDLLISLIVMLIVNIIVFFLYDLKIMKLYFNKKFEFKMNKRIILAIIYMALPLSFSSSLGSLSASIPRIFLKNLHGVYYLGIFSAIAYILVIASLFANSISQVFLPRLSNYYHNQQKEKFYKLSYKLILIGFILGISFLVLTLIFGRTLLQTGFGEEFKDYYLVLIILAVGLLFLLTGVFVGTIITSTGNYKIHYKISIITVASILLLSFPLINKYSIYGTAITIMLSQIVTTICYFYFYFKIFFSKKSRN